MLDAGVGALRTLPDPENGAVKWLRRSARSLGITWPRAMEAAELFDGLDPDRPEALALYMDATDSCTAPATRCSAANAPSRPPTPASRRHTRT